MKKVLIITTTASMIDQFNKQNIMVLMKLGYDISIVSNFCLGNTISLDRISELKKYLNSMNIKIIDINIARNSANILTNIIAYIKIYSIVKNENYSFIHCQSPVGGVIGRLLGKKLNIPVIYTAHGFHFYNGSSMLSWILYYPVEYLLSKYTDELVLINSEDYELASQLKAKKNWYIPGIGIDSKIKINNSNLYKKNKREELKISSNKIVLLSVGELNSNKNHIKVLKCLKKAKMKNVIYVICGIGKRSKILYRYAKKNDIDLRLLGYREDINDIYEISDIFIFPSKREGLPVSLMEAMRAGLPVIVSNIRGNRDLIKNERNG